MTHPRQNTWNPERFVSTAEIYRLIQSHGDLKPMKANPYDGPAQRYKIKGGQGEIELLEYGPRKCVRQMNSIGG